MKISVCSHNWPTESIQSSGRPPSCVWRYQCFPTVGTLKVFNLKVDFLQGYEEIYMFPLLGAGTLKLSILQVNLLFVYEDKCIPTVVTLKISNLKMDILQMHEDFKVLD